MKITKERLIDAGIAEAEWDWFALTAYHYYRDEEERQEGMQKILATLIRRTTHALSMRTRLFELLVDSWKEEDKANEKTSEI